jgi:hypothetical protein
VDFSELASSRFNIRVQTKIEVEVENKITTSLVLQVKASGKSY